VIIDPSEECRLEEPEESVKTNASEETEDANLKEQEKRRKARLRRRGPYRKAHADW
jgi:hypothetical protein